jgi:glutamine amidotransferase
MISVVDYGMGNSGSMINMLRKLGAQCELVRTPEDLDRAEKIILPGVGAFDQGISALAAKNLLDVLRKRVSINMVPILGVCLGMQMLGKGSEEGSREGLGFLDAFSRRFQFDSHSRLKVPHMGWQSLKVQKCSSLLDNYDSQSRFYFVHSYHLVCSDETDVLATASYGDDFVAMIQRGHIYGAQFHPEKSHRFGFELLKKFSEI